MIIIDDAHPNIGDTEFTQEVQGAYRRGIKASDIEVEDVFVDSVMFMDWSNGQNLPDQITCLKLMPVLVEINRSL